MSETPVLSTTATHDDFFQKEEIQKAMQAIVQAFCTAMKHHGIENFIQVEGHLEGERPIVVTVAWLDGLTPVKKYERHLAMLRIELDMADLARRTILGQLDELKAKIDAASPAVRAELGWVTGVGYVETKP